MTMWRRSPVCSARSRALQVLLAGAGVALSSWLTYTEVITDDGVGCFITSGCHVVQQSEYAHFLTVPVPVIGLIGWLLVLAAVWLGTPTIRLLLVGVGTAFVAYLQVVALLVVDAVCMWCVADAFLMFAITIVVVREWWHAVEGPREREGTGLAPAPDDPVR